MMSRPCDACGTMLLGYLTPIGTTNGALFLCEQCLSDINRKSPLLAAERHRADQQEGVAQKYYDKLQEWQELTGCSCPSEAERKLKAVQ